MNDRICIKLYLVPNVKITGKVRFRSLCYDIFLPILFQRIVDVFRSRDQ